MSDLKAWEQDNTLYLFTSLTAGSSIIHTRANRIETILLNARIPFTHIDTATDESAKKLFQRRAKNKKLPLLVKEGFVLATYEEVEEWNEFGELIDMIGEVGTGHERLVKAAPAKKTMTKVDFSKELGIPKTSSSASRATKTASSTKEESPVMQDAAAKAQPSQNDVQRQLAAEAAAAAKSKGSLPLKSIASKIREKSSVANDNTERLGTPNEPEAPPSPANVALPLSPTSLEPEESIGGHLQPGIKPTEEAVKSEDSVSTKQDQSTQPGNTSKGAFSSPGEEVYTETPTVPAASQNATTITPGGEEAAKAEETDALSLETTDVDEPENKDKAAPSAIVSPPTQLMDSPKKASIPPIDKPQVSMVTREESSGEPQVANVESPSVSTHVATHSDDNDTTIGKAQDTLVEVGETVAEKLRSIESSSLSATDLNDTQNDVQAAIVENTGVDSEKSAQQESLPGPGSETEARKEEEATAEEEQPALRKSEISFSADTKTEEKPADAVPVSQFRMQARQRGLSAGDKDDRGEKVIKDQFMYFFF